jgi:hypothetical protein
MADVDERCYRTMSGMTYCKPVEYAWVHTFSTHPLNIYRCTACTPSEHGELDLLYLDFSGIFWDSRSSLEVLWSPDAYSKKLFFVHVGPVPLKFSD